jgi:hypothetical protein
MHKWMNTSKGICKWTNNYVLNYATIYRIFPDRYVRNGCREQPEPRISFGRKVEDVARQRRKLQPKISWYVRANYYLADKTVEAEMVGARGTHWIKMFRRFLWETGRRDTTWHTGAVWTLKTNTEMYSKETKERLWVGFIWIRTGPRGVLVWTW